MTIWSGLAFYADNAFYRQGELEGKESEKGRFLPVFGSADRHCKVVTIQL